MNATVYYQNMELNANRGFTKDNLVYDPANAIKVGTLDRLWETLSEDRKGSCQRRTTVTDKDKIADYIFWSYNCGVGYQYLSDHQEIVDDHTSMSVGDYIKFGDGEIWICANAGWQVVKPKTQTLRPRRSVTPSR